MSKLDIDLAVMVGQYRQWVNKLLPMFVIEESP